ncbi:MAG TPA: cell division protein FtsL [Limnobacter sp.]|uniref:cell division protein FtsL n=1 Tax=Limnobacter sp. TaxID=2003368 RepID=UPI002ED808CC
MGRLNILLLALVIYCAMQVVDFQHEARTLFVTLGSEQEAERQLDVAFTRLQLQQVALAKGERVDEVARRELKMAPPQPGSIVFMPFDTGGSHE